MKLALKQTWKELIMGMGYIFAVLLLLTMILPDIFTKIVSDNGAVKLTVLIFIIFLIRCFTVYFRNAKKS